MNDDRWQEITDGIALDPAKRRLLKTGLGKLTTAYYRFRSPLTAAESRERAIKCLEVIQPFEGLLPREITRRLRLRYGSWTDENGKLWRMMRLPAPGPDTNTRRSIGNSEPQGAA